MTLVGKFEGKKIRGKWDDGQENNIKTGIEETVSEIVWNFNIFRRRWIFCLEKFKADFSKRQSL